MADLGLQGLERAAQVEADGAATGEQGGNTQVGAPLPQSALPELFIPLPGMEAEPGQIEHDQARSLARRGAFEDHLPDEWRERYHELVNRFGRWEIAALVLWSSLPKHLRQPGTQRELAQEVFGLTTDRVVCEWKRLPGVEDEIITTRSFALFDYVPDAMRTLGELATEKDYRNIPAMRLLFEMTGHYTPSQTLNVGVPRWVRDAAAAKREAQTDELEATAGIPVED